MQNKPAIAQLVEHLTVECCFNQMVPGSIPGGRILSMHVRNTIGDIELNAATYTLRLASPKHTHRGARTHDHKVKGLALCRLS